ncbi:MAG: hypothetical protein ACJ8CR_03675 [Roseiflexaceae bacterium]
MARKKATQRELNPLAAAREVARAVVARQWPELADVEPTVAPRGRHTPGADDMLRLGTAASTAPPSGEYTFTFTGQVSTPEGYIMPRVARVTVDRQQRVVKATTSK